MIEAQNTVCFSGLFLLVLGLLNGFIIPKSTCLFFGSHFSLPARDVGGKK